MGKKLREFLKKGQGTFEKEVSKALQENYRFLLKDKKEYYLDLFMGIRRVGFSKDKPEFLLEVQVPLMEHIPKYGTRWPGASKEERTVVLGGTILSDKQLRLLSNHQVLRESILDAVFRLFDAYNINFEKFVDLLKNCGEHSLETFRLYRLCFCFDKNGVSLKVKQRIFDAGSMIFSYFRWITRDAVEAVEDGILEAVNKVVG